MLVATPTYAKPDVTSVKARVDTLYHQAEQASERYNQARDSLKQARVQLQALQADLDRQQAKVDDVRQQVAAAVVSQYQGDALSSTTQVLLSKNPNAFLDQLSTVSQYNDQRSQMMADFAVQAKQLEIRQEAAKRQLAQIADTKTKLATEKAEIDKKAAAAKALLGRLQERAAAAQEPSRSAERVPLTTSVPTSGNASAAVQYAMAQVGKAYVYGAAGPNAFDCSGLTMAAWRQAGVSLPHSSSAQQGFGTPVSASNLRPGDLVFYYQPVSHVGMYIGNGMIVNAENPSAGIRVAPLYSMPFVGAVRPG
jgi:peptidoglycan DL-endopeptidase CwlO